MALLNHSLFMLSIFISISTSNAACTPCSISELGSINLNISNPWSNIGNTFCIGHTEHENETSATFYISLGINISHSDSNYKNGLTYKLAIYNDDIKSYESINSSMSCVEKLNPKRSKVVKDVRFESNTYFAEIVIRESITRQWWVFLTHCSQTEPTNIIYPIIDYNINVTQSSFVMQREKTCNGKTNELPIALILGIIGIVVFILSLSGLLIWGCDVYKRKKIKNEAMTQELIVEQNSTDNETSNDDQNSNDDGNNNDDIQLQSA